MIKQFTFFSLFTCCFLSLAAQVETQGDLMQITQFNDIDVSASGNGWAVGTCDVVARTTDGINWTLEEQPVSNDAFYQVLCADDNCQNVFFLGEENYRSTNGGETWTEFDPGVSIFGMERLPGSTRLYAGSGGSEDYYLSDDGGDSWTTYQYPVSPSTSLRFVSASKGYFFKNNLDTGNRDMYVSIDGGESWTATGGSAPASGMRHWFFLDENVGWAAYNSSDVLYKTTDGGANWVEVPNVDLPFNTSVMDALSETELVAITITQSVHRSTDGGVTWNFESEVDPDGVFVKSSYHRNGDEFWLVSSESGIYYSAAGFTNWLPGVEASRTRIDAVAFVDDNTGFFSKSNGLYRTTNGGDDWDMIQNFTGIRQLEILPNGDLLAIRLGNPEVSNDQGETFTDYLSPTAEALFDGSSPSLYGEAPGGRQFFLGFNTLIYSDNGGANWTAVNHDVGMSLDEIYFYDDNLIFVSGSGGGAFYRSTDGGLNWEDMTDISPTSQPLEDFYFSDANNGIAFNGSRGYRTTDGGDTWTDDQSLPGAYQLQKTEDGRLIANAFGGGNNGELWLSEDDGANWERIVFICSPMRTADLTPSGRYHFAGTDAGSIIRTDLDNLVGTFTPRNPVTELQVFPNPTTGLVSLQLPEALTQGAVNAHLYDSQGKLLTQQQYTGNTILNMDISNYPAGWYSLRLVSADQVYVARITKQ